MRFVCSPPSRYSRFQLGLAMRRDTRWYTILDYYSRLDGLLALSSEVCRDYRYADIWSRRSSTALGVMFVLGLCSIGGSINYDNVDCAVMSLWNMIIDKGEDHIDVKRHALYGKLPVVTYLPSVLNEEFYQRDFYSYCMTGCHPVTEKRGRVIKRQRRVDNKRVRAANITKSLRVCGFQVS